MKRILPLLLISAASMQAYAVSPYLNKVWEYRPAPGQFVNLLPEYEEGDTEEDIISKAEEAICFERMPGMISLGAYGGYVTVAFDHPVVNAHGKYDFRIFGNSFVTDETTASAEPGIVLVSRDVNGNGLPDDPWYELAGSEYNNPKTLHDFNISYFRPDPSATPNPDGDNAAITDAHYIRFSTNDPAMAEGYIARNVFHTQSYWPEWLDDDTLSFSGALLPDNFTETDGVFSSAPFPWGYADNQPNVDEKGFSLDWAVDDEGKPVVLTHADFIRIYTAECRQMGHLGEESTEISGGEDLHPDAVYSPEWPENPDVPGSVSRIEIADWALLTSHAGVLTLRLSETIEFNLYSTAGREAMRFSLAEGTHSIDITSLPSGIYILRGGSKTLKITR
ncbi:MAG: T9SS type A sorting domain-containing protein [Bacteroidales bacterium]|nr:T9SS type A sorting domain-containing protein [Bacteroidales bacterium]